MTQETRVLKVDTATARELEARLQEALPTAEWRNTPHARFALKADGVVVTCYTSGKLVVQGRDLDTFAGRFLGELAPAAPRERSKGKDDADMPLDRRTVASDEAGKGDYFGPLVVAAVHATPDDAAALEEAGIADSKTLSDDRAHRLRGIVERQLDHAIRVVPPEEYNRRHREKGNLNLLLAELHADVLGELVGRHRDAEVAIVDRFGAEAEVARQLHDRIGVAMPLEQVPRAERHLAVAAASILARSAFLEGLAACSDACGTDLHKGAGPPVDTAARRVVEIGGRDLLATVAKLHFRNTARVLPS